MFVFLLFYFVRFPKNRMIAVQWNAALGIDTSLFVQGLICADHFEDKYFKRKNKTELKPGAVPTLFTHQESPSDNQSCDLEYLNSNTCDQIVPENIAVLGDDGNDVEFGELYTL